MCIYIYTQTQIYVWRETERQRKREKEMEIAHHTKANINSSQITHLNVKDKTIIWKKCKRISSRMWGRQIVLKKDIKIINDKQDSIKIKNVCSKKHYPSESEKEPTLLETIFRISISNHGLESKCRKDCYNKQNADDSIF